MIKYEETKQQFKMSITTSLTLINFKTILYIEYKTNQLIQISIRIYILLHHSTKHCKSINNSNSIWVSIQSTTNLHKHYLIKIYSDVS